MPLWLFRTGMIIERSERSRWQGATPGPRDSGRSANELSNVIISLPSTTPDAMSTAFGEIQQMVAVRQQDQRRNGRRCSMLSPPDQTSLDPTHALRLREKVYPI